VKHVVNTPKKLNFELTNLTIRDDFDFLEGLTESVDVNNEKALVINEVIMTNLSFFSLEQVMKMKDTLIKMF
jgi:hypothetical protein